MNKRMTGKTRRVSLVGICLSLFGIGLLAIPALQLTSAGAATLRNMGNGWCWGSTTTLGTFGAFGGNCTTTTTGDTPKTTCTNMGSTTTTEATTTTTESTTTTTQPTSPTQTTATTAATTTTTEGTTTTSLGVEGSTTLVTSTTAPHSSTSGTVGGQGGTVAPPTTSGTVAGAATLPRTGLDWAFPVVFGLSALLGGGMLVRRRRTFWSRD